MPLVAIVGTIGTGKTLAMVWRAYELAKRGHPIYANIDLAGIPYTKINTLDDFDSIRGIPGKEAIVLMDEFWRWLDSRQWKKDKNNTLTKLIMYSRKRNFWIFYTVQRFHMMEKRIRDITDAVIEPELGSERIVMFGGRKQKLPLKCTIYWRQVEPKATGVGYTINKTPYRVQKFCPLLVFNKYDTHQEVGAI
jgi:hypothetical protein